MLVFMNKDRMTETHIISLLFRATRQIPNLAQSIPDRFSKLVLIRFLNRVQVTCGHPDESMADIVESLKP